MKKILCVSACAILIVLSIIPTYAAEFNEDGSINLYYDEPWTVMLNKSGTYSTSFFQLNCVNYFDTEDNYTFYERNYNLLCTDDVLYMGEYTGVRFDDVDNDGFDDFVYGFRFTADVDSDYVFNGETIICAVKEVDVIILNPYGAFANLNNISVCQTTRYAEEPIANTATTDQCFYFTFHTAMNSNAEYPNTALMNSNQVIGCRVTFRTYEEDFVKQYSRMPDMNTPIQNIWLQGYANNIGVLTYQDGLKKGRQVGFDEGYKKAYDLYNEQNVDEMDMQKLLTGILTAPVEMVKASLGFEIFGVNLQNFVTFLVTAVIVLFIVVVILRITHK